LKINTKLFEGVVMLKVSIIGGGSTYTPELVQGFLDRQEQFPLDELCLMDTDPERLEIVGGFATRMAADQNAGFKISLTENREDAICEASYVITQMRVGKMKARREDEYLGKRYGLIGQETTGIGGMAKGLRTIPVMLDIAHTIRSIAPKALLLNFANPSGMITEALNRYTPDVKAVGVCNATLTTKMEILENLNERLRLNLKPDDAQIKALGLNHLTWFYGFHVDGKDYWPQIMAGIIEDMKSEKDPFFDHHTLEVLQMLPNYYLRYYYYTEKLLSQQKNWPPSRAEEVMEIERTLLDHYADQTNVTPPDALMARGGAFYSTVATQLINAHYNNLGEIHILNVRHNGAVPGWDSDWVLELPCMVSSEGIIPLPASTLPLVCESLIQKVKAYEILTAKAAVEGDRNAAYQALLTHPLGPDADKINQVLEDMLEINRPYLPNFFK
jgi:6-phospho-beta-glucosidase